MALFYYQALERNGRKTKGMIEADSARHARQLLRGKDLIPVHIEARMNASAGDCCSVGGTHIVARRRQIWRCSLVNWQRWCRQQCRWKPAYRRSVSKAKTACKSLGMALRSQFRKVIPCRTACANIPASLTPCFVRWSPPEKIRASRRGAQSPGGLHRTAAASEITPAAGHALPAGTAGGGNGRGHYFADGSSAENYRTV